MGKDALAVHGRGGIAFADTGETDAWAFPHRRRTLQLHCGALAAARREISWTPPMETADHARDGVPVRARTTTDEDEEAARDREAHGGREHEHDGVRDGEDQRRDAERVHHAEAPARGRRRRDRAVVASGRVSAPWGARGMG